MEYCPFCKNEHAIETDCEERAAALRRMNAKNAERIRASLYEAREWPPRERTVRRWTSHGLECAVSRGPVCLCGYVRVPEGHPDERKHYDAVDVRIHGGITFRQKDDTGGSWFGFDTSHAHDWVGLLDIGLEIPGRIWTVDDVVAETERLAEQLAARADAKSSTTHE